MGGPRLFRKKCLKYPDPQTPPPPNKKKEPSLFLVHPCPISSFHRAITRHAINCFVRRSGYVSNTSGKLFSLPVIFVLEEVEGRVRCFCVGICEGSCMRFSQKMSKVPQPIPPLPYPIKNLPSYENKNRKLRIQWLW